MFELSERFQEETLSKIIADKENLFALFVSYHGVGIHNSGPVETVKKGLKILIQSGDLNYSAESLLATFEDLQSPAEVIPKAKEFMHDEAMMAHREMERQVDENVVVDSDDSNMLAVVYVGYSAFTENCAYVRKLHNKFPKATIILVACDCDESRKVAEFEKMRKNNTILEYIICGDCGGRSTMKKVLKTLISNWPNK